MKPHAAYITGGLTASTAFSNQQVVARPCLDGWFCPTRVTKVEGRLCNWLVSFCNASCILKMKTSSFPVSDSPLCSPIQNEQVPTDGQSCGEPGEYDISYNMQLPDEEEFGSFLTWFFDADALTMKIKVQKETDCQSWATKAYSMVSMGVAVLAGVAVALKRMLVIPDEDDDVQDGTYREEQSYVEMCESDMSSVNSWRSVNQSTCNRSINDEGRDQPPSSASQVLPIGAYLDSISPGTTKGNEQIPLDVLRQWYEKHGITIV